MVEPPDYLETRFSCDEISSSCSANWFGFFVATYSLKLWIDKEVINSWCTKTWLNQPCTHRELSKLVLDVLYKQQHPLCEPTSAPFKNQQIS